MALVLALAYVVLLVVPAGRAIFALQALGLPELAIVAGGVVAWAILLWLTWRYRLVERFLGI